MCLFDGERHQLCFRSGKRSLVPQGGSASWWNWVGWPSLGLPELTLLQAPWAFPPVLDGREDSHMAPPFPWPGVGLAPCPQSASPAYAMPLPFADGDREESCTEDVPNVPWWLPSPFVSCIPSSLSSCVSGIADYKAVSSLHRSWLRVLELLSQRASETTSGSS